MRNTKTEDGSGTDAGGTMVWSPERGDGLTTGKKVDQSGSIVAG